MPIASFPIPGPLRLYFWLIVAAGLTAQLLGVYQSQIAGGTLSDFGRFFYGALTWREGGSFYTPTVATPLPLTDGTVLAQSNLASPLFHVLVLPFTYLPPATAYVLWMVVNVVAWLACLRLCLREWSFTVDPRWCSVIALALLCSRIYGAAFYTGQYVGLLMVPATYAWILARRGQDVGSAVLIGVLASQKPFALLFLAWFAWQGRWRAAGAGVLSLVGAVGLGVLIFGLESHREWIAALNDSTSQWIWFELNASLWAPFARALAPSTRFAHSPGLAPLYLAGVWTALAALVLASWSRLRRPGRLDDTWAALWCCALLASPLGWTYYLWWALGPFGSAVHRVWTEHPGLRKWVVGIGVIAVLPLDALFIGQPSPAASFTIGSLYSWALLTLLGLVLTARNHAYATP